jgi:hypothetical protein
LLLIFRSLIATIGAAYFAIRGFIQPVLQDRDRIWCERWTGLAFGVITIAVGSVLITMLERDGIIIVTAGSLVASCGCCSSASICSSSPRAALRFPGDLSSEPCNAGSGGPNAASAPTAMYTLVFTVSSPIRKSFKHHLPVWNLAGS